jgi:hypothetical protein
VGRHEWDHLDRGGGGAGPGVSRTVGWLDHGDGSVEFAYAAPGDTNLDWQLDVLDVANVLTSGRFDTGQPATWFEGDFNYDGVVDILDTADVVATGLYDAGSYNPSPVAERVAVVPEPSAACLLAAGGLGHVLFGRVFLRWACLGRAISGRRRRQSGFGRGANQG